MKPCIIQQEVEVVVVCRILYREVMEGGLPVGNGRRIVQHGATTMMAKFKVTYKPTASRGGLSEVVKADTYCETGRWIDFHSGTKSAVLRVSADDVARIEQVDFLYRSPLASWMYFLSRYQFDYDFGFTPVQLFYICECIAKTRELPGPIIEIGCGRGRTTVFLNKYMDATNLSKAYICIDTFAGFTAEDVNHEVLVRGKQTNWRMFDKNRKAWFERVIRRNAITRVDVVQGDVNPHDLTQYHNVSMCLIDVDLYRPVKSSLEGIYDRMARGGVVIIDDCRPDYTFDGAHAAYLEFAAQRGLPVEIVLDKLGVLWR